MAGGESLPEIRIRVCRIGRDKLFITMAGVAIEPSEHFQLPANRVVELGEQMLI